MAENVGKWHKVEIAFDETARLYIRENDELPLCMDRSAAVKKIEEYDENLGGRE